MLKITKHLTILQIIVVLLLASICSAQPIEKKLGTIHIKKGNYPEPKSIGLRIFKLYCKEAIDTLMSEYFPTKDIFIALCKQSNLEPDNEAYKNAQEDFRKIERYDIKRLTEKIKADKAHNIRLESLTVDSITFEKQENATFRGGRNWSLLFITIHCKDRNNNYNFRICPLFAYKNKWYIFETDLGFMK